MAKTNKSSQKNKRKIGKQPKITLNEIEEPSLLNLNDIVICSDGATGRVIYKSRTLFHKHPITKIIWFDSDNSSYICKYIKGSSIFATSKSKFYKVTFK